jgi:hypothetical protein
MVQNGLFTVELVYKHLCRNGVDRSFKHLWKRKLPLKIKVWLWLIWHNAIATKENLIKRNWSGNVLCRFCNDRETISHLFFGCVAAKFVWSAVATVINSPTCPGRFSQFFPMVSPFYSCKPQHPDCWVGSCLLGYLEAQKHSMF